PCTPSLGPIERRESRRGCWINRGISWQAPSRYSEWSSSRSHSPPRLLSHNSCICMSPSASFSHPLRNLHGSSFSDTTKISSLSRFPLPLNL
ncbi:hypothetical protein PENTCL1PPCAC_28972, partial [Pristionchus entomophagus]